MDHVIFEKIIKKFWICGILKIYTSKICMYIYTVHTLGTCNNVGIRQWSGMWD